MITNWLQQNYEEIIAVVTGLIYILLSIRQNILLWPLGLLSSLFLIFVNYHAKLYANTGLQAFYVIMSIYGWYYWAIGSKVKKDNNNEFSVRNMSFKTIGRLIIVALPLEIIFYIILKHFDSTNPVLDSLTTTMGILATWMLARKYIENWLVWIVIDVISAGLYIHIHLYLTTGLFVAFSILAAVGYFEWKKSQKPLY